MGKKSFTKIRNELRGVEQSSLPELHMSILRNITLEPIESYWKYLAYQMGYKAAVQWGQYDRILDEAIRGKEDIFGSNVDCILIFMKLENFSWNLARNLPGLNDQQIQLEINRINNYVVEVLENIRHKTQAPILWHGFEIPSYPSEALCHGQMKNGHVSVIGHLNTCLQEFLQKALNAYFVDLNRILLRLGYKNFYDFRFWHIGQQPFTLEGLKEIAMEDFKWIRAIKGKNKKCLVLDCDNVLWGGIIGEDGLAGIKLGKTYPGSMYYEFQQEILNLYHQGILIALCSKNNEEDVFEVLEKHPGMLLKKEHIVTAKINWRNKTENLKQIAEDLNLGLDSLVMVEDSPFEAGLVQRFLPEVEVLEFNAEKPFEYRNILSSCGLFETLISSKEDQTRTQMYQTEAKRKEMRKEALSLEDYYKTLEMELAIHLVDDFSVPRLAQLTQRTNQFNLTTRRYTESDVRKLQRNSLADILYIQLKDKLGDSGIVGVCILKYKDQKAVMDTFLLSCRVLGRDVEKAFLNQALCLAQKKGCTSVIGEYYPTPKNVQVKDFYLSQGFKMIEADDKNVLRFQYPLNKAISRKLGFFKNIYSYINQHSEIKL